jgi:hypothetical protein
MNCVALAKLGQYGNKKKQGNVKKTPSCFFKYGLAKVYFIFPIVRIFQITRKLMNNGRISTAGRPLVINKSIKACFIS